MSALIKKICFNNLVDYWKSIATTKLSTCVDGESYVSVKTGINTPLFNPLFLKENARELPRSQIGAPHSIWYDFDRNRKIPLSEFQNMELIIERLPVMAIHLNKSLEKKSTTQFEIEIAGNNVDLREAFVPVQTSFEMDDAATACYLEGLENAPEKFVHFVAKKDDRIVGFASLFLHHEIAGLYNLAVLPECRKQGIAMGLHVARLNEAKKREYRYATLQATPMAASLGQAAGFEKYSEISIYKC